MFVIHPLFSEFNVVSYEIYEVSKCISWMSNQTSGLPAPIYVDTFIIHEYERLRGLENP